jgi:hypothetical protein
MGGPMMGPGGPMGGPPGGAPMGGGPMMPGAGGGDVNTTLPLILSIVSLFCCGLGTLLGIGGLVLSLQAGTAKKNGDLVTAQAKAKTATILAAVGIGIGLVSGILSAILRG